MRYTGHSLISPKSRAGPNRVSHLGQGCCRLLSIFERGSTTLKSDSRARCRAWRVNTVHFFSLGRRAHGVGIVLELVEHRIHPLIRDRSYGKRLSTAEAKYRTRLLKLWPTLVPIYHNHRVCDVFFVAGYWEATYL